MVANVGGAEIAICPPLVSQACFVEEVVALGDALVFRFSVGTAVR